MSRAKIRYDIDLSEVKVRGIERLRRVEERLRRIHRVADRAIAHLAFYAPEAATALHGELPDGFQAGGFVLPVEDLEVIHPGCVVARNPDGELEVRTVPPGASLESVALAIEKGLEEPELDDDEPPA